MKSWLVVLEWVVGVLAIVLGLLLQVMLMYQGVLVPGALMLIVTGTMLCVIAWRDQKGILFSRMGESFMVIFRRTLLFLNIMLSVLVALTLCGVLV